MKIRNDYVSNSSSSSFLIQAEEDNKYLLCREDLKKLEDYGFHYVAGKADENVYNCRINYVSKVSEWADKYLYLDVLCNQEDVIEFLTKNKISFIGSIHNDEYLVLYDKNNDYYEIYVNYGIKRTMTSSNESFMEDLDFNPEPYRKIYFGKKEEI